MFSESELKDRINSIKFEKKLEYDHLWMLYDGYRLGVIHSPIIIKKHWYSKKFAYCPNCRKPLGIKTLSGKMNYDLNPDVYHFICDCGYEFYGAWSTLGEFRPESPIYL